MRRTLTLTTALAASAVLALGAGSGAAAKSKRVTQISCGLELTAQGPPQGTPPATQSFGVVSCPRPFGAGVHQGSSTATAPVDGRGTFAVNFKKYFDRGTIRGTVTGTFTASPPNVANTGTVAIAGGTGAYRRARGTGTLNCASTDGGVHRSCTFTLKLTGV